jgi:hypothetical protein
VPAALARWQQRHPRDEGFHDAPASVKGERGPFLFKVAVGEGVRQLSRVPAFLSL